MTFSCFSVFSIWNCLVVCLNHPGTLERTAGRPMLDSFWAFALMFLKWKGKICNSACIQSLNSVWNEKLRVQRRRWDASLTIRFDIHSQTSSYEIFFNSTRRFCKFVQMFFGETIGTSFDSKDLHKTTENKPRGIAERFHLFCLSSFKNFRQIINENFCSTLANLTLIAWLENSFVSHLVNFAKSAQNTYSTFSNRNERLQVCFPFNLGNFQSKKPTREETTARLFGSFRTNDLRNKYAIPL